MCEPAQKCENNAIFKQNSTLKLLIVFKMAYSWCFGLSVHLEFPNFLQKKFYKINYRSLNLLLVSVCDQLYNFCRKLV